MNFDIRVDIVKRDSRMWGTKPTKEDMRLINHGYIISDFKILTNNVLVLKQLTMMEYVGGIREWCFDNISFDDWTSYTNACRDGWWRGPKIKFFFRNEEDVVKFKLKFSEDLL